MRKMTAVCLAGVIGAAAVAGLAGCGDYKVPNVEGEKAAPAYADAQATLTVDAKLGGEDNKISDELFGVFLEDINYASYALDADLVANGSFEALSAAKDYGWTATKARLSVESGEGVLAGTEAYGARGVNASYAKVHVTSAGGGVSNAGYEAQTLPIAVKEGTNYRFSAFVKSSSAAHMTVKIAGGGTEYGSSEIALSAGGEWIKYEREIAATGTADKGLRLEITFDETGDYYLDGVRLETEDATLGIKNYLYEAIAELSPKFIRFPGGCIIEGDGHNTGTIEVYDWKNSVGAVQTGDNAGDDAVPAFTYKLDTDGTAKETTTYGEPVVRKPNIDLWNGSIYYDMTYSLGFLEYFKLCESVGASAVPVLNCGLSCQGGGASDPRALEGRHNKGVEDYIRDAIDLIEFAKGDTSTKWGKIRADMGHPEPFEMNYIGIGNEQSGVYYTDYYEKFLKDEAFQAALEKYSVKTIVGNATQFADCQNFPNNNKGTAQKAAEKYVKENGLRYLSDYGVHDQHYYVNYSALLTHTDMYDSYDRRSRDRYEVFVGEYSCNQEASNYPEHENEWITALSEAAMMTAYERNGDIVVLAAYAPMFASVTASARQWAVDMMYFTNTELVRTANYYVQQLFMKNFAGYKPSALTLAFADGGDNSYAFPSPFAATRTVKAKRLYYTACEEKNGDVIVKLVNVSPDPLKLNLALKNAKLSGLADVTVLKNTDLKAKNTLENLASPAVAPETYTLGSFGGTTVGFEVEGYSVTALRFHTAK